MPSEDAQVAVYRAACWRRRACSPETGRWSSARHRYANRRPDYTAAWRAGVWRGHLPARSWIGQEQHGAQHGIAGTVGLIKAILSLRRGRCRLLHFNRLPDEFDVETALCAASGYAVAQR